MPGCNECKFYKSEISFYSEKSIRTCAAGNTGLMLTWWEENGKKFDDLTEKEQYLLLSKLEDAYYLFHKKEIDTNVLLIYMQENNPTCEWNGKHEKFEDGKLIRVWTVHRKHTLEIFEL